MLLDSVDHARIPHIYIAYDTNNNAGAIALAADMHSLCALPATQVDISLFWPPQLTYGLEPLLDADGRCRVFTLCFFGPFYLPDAFFARITVLSLDGLATSPVVHFPPLPALRHLTLVCGSAHDGQHCVPPVLPPRLQCSPLAELVLTRSATCTGQALWSLRADAIVQLITASLTEGVNSLVVRGAELVAPGLDALQACVAHLEVNASASPAEVWADSIDFQTVWGPALE